MDTLPAVVDIGGSALPGFATALLLVALNADGIVLNGGSGGLTSVSINQLIIPTDKSGGIHPRFIGAARMTTIPAYQLLNATAELPSTQNRIVIIGVAAKGIGEAFVTPAGLPISGGMLQAEAVESILADDALSRPFWAHNAELLVGIAISILVGLNLGRIPYRGSAVLVAAALALPVSGSIYLFLYCNILLDSVFPVSSLLLTCAEASTARIGTEVKARQQREAELAVAIIRRGAAERETRLRDEADRLRQNLALAIDAAQLGTWDANLTLGEWRHTARHDMILGLTSPPDRWSSAVLIDHVVPEERDRVIDSLAAAEANGALQLECRITWPDGSVHHVQLLGRFWHDQRDNTARVAGVVADVTHQRTLELRLR